MAMIPKLHISTLGPYSLRVTTSGAIQYGVPTIVVRFAEAGSDIWAQNPKSAAAHASECKLNHEWQVLTELDITRHAQEYIIALDITMDNAMSMQVL